MQPRLDGYGASRSGATLAGLSTQGGQSADAQGSMALGMTNPLAWGFLAALALMAYWYRRVL